MSTSEKWDNAYELIRDFQAELATCGLNYNAEVSLWEGNADDTVFTTHATSDKITDRRTLSTAILEDGRGRLIETHEYSYPIENLHKDGVTAIHRNGSVAYTDEPINAEAGKFFSTITEIFKVDHT